MLMVPIVAPLCQNRAGRWRGVRRAAGGVKNCSEIGWTGSRPSLGRRASSVKCGEKTQALTRVSGHKRLKSRTHSGVYPIWNNRGRTTFVFKTFKNNGGLPEYARLHVQEIIQSPWGGVSFFLTPGKKQLPNPLRGNDIHPFGKGIA